MKRKIAIALLTSLVISLTACASKGDNLPPIDVTEKEQTKTVEADVNTNNYTNSTEDKKELTEVDKELNNEVVDSTNDNIVKDKEYFEGIIDKLVIPDNHVKLTCSDDTGATSTCEIVDNTKMLMTINPNQTDITDMIIFIDNKNMYISGDIEGTNKSFVLKDASSNGKKEKELESTVDSMKPELFALESIDEVIEENDKYVIKGKISNINSTSENNTDSSDINGTITVNGEKHDISEYQREFIESYITVDKDTDEIKELKYTEKVGDRTNTTTITVEYCDKLSMSEADFINAEEVSADEMALAMISMIFNMAGVE